VLITVYADELVGQQHEQHQHLLTLTVVKAAGLTPQLVDYHQSLFNLIASMEISGNFA